MESISKQYKLNVGSDRIGAELRFMSNWVLHMNLAPAMDAAQRILSGPISQEDATIVRKTIAAFNKDSRLPGLESIVSI